MNNKQITNKHCMTLQVKKEVLMKNILVGFTLEFPQEIDLR